MPPRTEAPPRGPAHLSRTRHPTPWTRQTPRVVDRPAPARRRTGPGPTPVFVDDSGRRRRAGRVLGTGLGLLVVAYVTVVGLTFAGAPLVGRLAPPGVAQLSRPTPDDAADVVGPGARETELPSAAAPPGPLSATDPATGADPGGSPDDPSGAGVTTSAPPTTTTTAPGQGATTSVPTPSSTVPDRTHPTAGGRPTEPPGKP